LDVVAAWTEDHRTLTVAVVNPTDAAQSLQVKLNGVPLTSKGTLWRLASEEADGKNPKVSSSPLEAMPASLDLPRFSVSIYEVTAK